MTALIPWLIIILFSLVFAGFLNKRLKISVTTSLTLAFSLTPILTGQILYILFILSPKNNYPFYHAASLTILALLIYVFIRLGDLKSLLHQIPRLSLKLDFMSRFYLITIVSVLVFVFVRLIYWPIEWGDQIEYYFMSHSYFVTRSVWTDVLHPLLGKVTVGIRPGLPMIASFTALFNSNNIVMERQLQFIIFYYFILSLLFLYILVRDQTKSKKIGLLAVFLLISCFFFTNFVIFGFKEIIIIALILACYMLFKEYIHNSKEKVVLRVTLLRAVFLGMLLGAMSFIHFTGSVSAIFVFVPFIVILPLNIKNKIIIAIITILIMYLSSLGETKYFIIWAIKGLRIPPFLSAENTTLISIIQNLIFSPNIQDSFSTGELGSFGIVSLLDPLLKGKMQFLTQIQSFGLVFWFVICLVLLNIRNVLRDKVNVIVGLFSLLFLLLIFNPLSLINHQSSYVFLVSPKYYLIILPTIIILALGNYTLFIRILLGIKHSMIIFISLTLLIFNTIFYLYMNRFVNLIGIFIPLHYRSDEYYIGKFREFTLLLIFMSVLILILIFLRSKMLKRVPLRELFFIGNLFLIPFIFLMNNNFDTVNTLTKISLNREDKIGIMSKANPEYYEIIAAVVKNYNKGQTVLMMDSMSYKATNYYLLSENNLFFKNKELPKIIYKYGSVEDEKFNADLVVYGLGNELPEKYAKNYSIVYTGKYGSVLKLK